MDAPPPCASLLAAHLAASVAEGALSAVLASVLQDGKVTGNEARSVAEAGEQVHAAIVNLVAMAYAAAQPVKLQVAA
jgi:hypothetical protein